MHVKETLRELCGIPGPSGFERSVAERAVSLLREVLGEAEIDRFGNAVGIRRCGMPNAKKVLLDAHLDEVGLIVSGIEEGFLHFRSIGGVDPRMLPDREVMVLTDPPIFGLVACLPPHVQGSGDADKGTPMKDLLIDVGMDQQKAEKAIPIGTAISFRSSFREMVNGLVCGKSIDDRAGFVALLRTAEILREKQLDIDLYMIGSTREEIGGSGGAVGAFSIAPDCCIAVDVTHGRTPDGPKDSTFELGVGPVIGIGPNMNHWMTDRMIACAEKLTYQWQPEVMAGNTGTNAWKIQIAREGIATSVVSIPLKYMHSPVEMLDPTDIEMAANLLASFIENLGMEGAWGSC